MVLWYYYEIDRTTIGLHDPLVSFSAGSDINYNNFPFFAFLVKLPFDRLMHESIWSSTLKFFSHLRLILYFQDLVCLF